MTTGRNSRRSISDNGYLLDLLDILECPVCLETCKPPIETCINGHNICSECRGMIEQCPLCRGDFQGTRNFTAEKLYEQIQQHTSTGNPSTTISCPSSQNGTVGLNCPFKHSDGLDTIISFSDYIDHLKNYHNVFDVLPRMVSKNGIFTKRNFIHGPNLIRNGPSKMFTMPFQNRTFVVQCHQGYGRRKCVWIWVALHGAESERNKFRTTLTVKSVDQNLPKLEWTGSVKFLTADQPNQVVGDNGKSLKTNAEELERYTELSFDGMKRLWNLTVKINHISREGEPRRQTGNTNLIGVSNIARNLPSELEILRERNRNTMPNTTSPNSSATNSARIVPNSGTQVVDNYYPETDNYITPVIRRRKKRCIVM